jgi:hypothetical protein
MVAGDYPSSLLTLASSKHASIVLETTIDDPETRSNKQYEVITV